MNTPTPYYLADINAFKSNAKRLQKAIKDHYSNYRLAYSFKTNYYGGFLNAALDSGLFAEVVSYDELRLAHSVGFSDERIIWNGVLPSLEHKLNFIESGGIANIDNMTELKSLIDEWTHETPMPVGLRFDIYSLTQGETRFGFTSHEIGELMRYVRQEKIKVVSVHCHISNARDVDSFRKRIEIMAKRAKEFGASIMDIGGNMYGPMHPDFAKQYGCFIPSLEEYGLIIGKEMKKHFPNEEVTMITENGTALVGSAMDLVATVIKRECRNCEPSITLDCKFSDIGFSRNHKNPVIECLGVDSKDIHNAIVYGCSCLERDIIHRDFSGAVNVGDKVVIRNVGAYSLNVTNNFISSIPAVVNK